MALKVKLEKLEDVAESFRTLYKKQDDGSFLLETEGEPEAGALKETLRKERRERAEVERKLKAINKTPEEITELEDRLAELEASATANGKPAVEQQITAAVTKATKPLQTLLDAANATIKEQQAFIDEQVREIAAQAVFADLGDWELLKPHVLPKLKSTREDKDGKPHWNVAVVDESGEERSGFTIEKLAEEMQSSGKFSRAFDGTGASGSGAQPSGGARRGAPRSEAPSGGAERKRDASYNAL